MCCSRVGAAVEVVVEGSEPAELNTVGSDRADSIAPVLEQPGEGKKELSGRRVDLAVLELHDPNPLLGELPRYPAQNLPLEPLDIDPQIIDD
jgi:hypothetical protein